MPQAIALAIETRGQLIAEAVRTGKDFRISRARALVRRQGDRLHRDQDRAGPALPARSAAHPRCIESAGVGCAAQGPGQLRLPSSSRACIHPGNFASRADAAHLPRIASFALHVDDRRQSELADVPENAGIWADVTSTRENCLGSECADYDRCFVMKHASRRSRRMSWSSTITCFRRRHAQGRRPDRVLPACNTVILDEAHQLRNRNAVLRRGNQRRKPG